jgi:hypothetical protein
MSRRYSPDADGWERLRADAETSRKHHEYQELLRAIGRLLNYSFRDIAWDYDQLTAGPDGEQACITREQFAELAWLFREPTS